MKIKISAPTKVILFGEHYVVYGAPALSIAVDVRREMVLEENEDGGKEYIRIENPVYKEGGLIYPDGGVEGHPYINMHAAIYREVYNKSGKLGGRAFTATLLGNRVFKGMGASSALGACMAKGLYAYAGVPADDEEIFRCTQIGDEIAHGGRPSGIDARTVVHGGMIKFWKEFNPPAFNFEKIRFELPRDTTLLIVDTFRGKRCSTGDLVALFAKNNGIEKKPNEMSQEERNRVIKQYGVIYGRALRELHANGDAKELGWLMNENHTHLKRAGVSTPVIEEAVQIILDNGGLGAKITGAGGDGGALIGYMWNKDKEQIAKALKENNFDSIELMPTNDGVRIEEED